MANIDVILDWRLKEGRIRRLWSNFGWVGADSNEEEQGGLWAMSSLH